MSEKIQVGYVTKVEVEITKDTSAAARMLAGIDGAIYKVTAVGYPDITATVAPVGATMYAAAAVSNDAEAVSEGESPEIAVRNAIGSLLCDMMSQRDRLVDWLEGSKQAAAEPSLGSAARALAADEVERLTEELEAYDKQAEAERDAARKE